MVTDDQRWDAWGHGQTDPNSSGRLPWMVGATPAMDRLAAEGVHFNNAFVVNALCSPSRAAMLTGQYNHDNRVVNNHTPLAATLPNFAKSLRDAGWRTGYFGKFHMGNQATRPGFQDIATFIGQGRYNDCEFLVDGVKTPTTGWVDDRTTDFALDFIDDHQGERFAMFVGFKSPHTPTTPPPRLADRFPGISNVLSPSRTAFVPFDPDPQVYQPTASVLRTYSQTVVGADQNLGRILKRLDDLQIAQDTIVVFASDNGFFLGDHSRADKRLAYEESIRIPLILRYPRIGHAGTHVDGMVLNIDLAPTLLGFAGVPVPAAMQGKDLRPLLATPEVPVRGEFLYEYFFERNFDSPTIVALRRKRKVLVTYPGHPGWVQLFDLAADPHQRENLAPRPAHAALLADMRAGLDAIKTATGYHVPTTADPPP